jgi:hypothetical protein
MSASDPGPFDPALEDQFARMLAKTTQGEWSAEDPHDACCGSPCTVDGCHESHPAGEVLLHGPPGDDRDLRFERPDDAKFCAFAHNRLPELLAEFREMESVLSLKSIWLRKAEERAERFEAERDRLLALLELYRKEHAMTGCAYSSCDICEAEARPHIDKVREIRSGL